MLTLIARWTIKKDCNAKAVAALKKLAKAVEAEPGTLMYLVHTPDPIQFTDQGGNVHESLPTASTQEVLFFEQYKNKQAYLDHVSGPTFQAFLKDYGDLFVSSHGNSFVEVEFLTRQAGFIREEVVAGKLAKKGSS